MIKKYRKKPVEISAVVWTGNNVKEVMDFINDSRKHTFNGTALYIETLEGIMKASLDDYIIRGVDGEFYPCKPDIFEKTYDEV